MKFAVVLGLLGVLLTQQWNADALRLVGTARTAASLSSMRARVGAGFKTSQPVLSMRSGQWKRFMTEVDVDAAAAAAAASVAETTAETAPVAASDAAQDKALDMDLVVTADESPAPLAAAPAQSALSAAADDATLSLPAAEGAEGDSPNYVQNEFSVFIGKLPMGMTQDAFTQFVTERLGASPFVSIKLVTNRYNGRSKGFGYVNFADKESTEQGVALLKGLSFNGVDCHVDVAEYPSKTAGRRDTNRSLVQSHMQRLDGQQQQPFAGGEPRRTQFTPKPSPEEEEARSRCSLHIAGVPSLIASDLLKKELEESLGTTVEEINIHSSANGGPLGYCFVRLKSEEEVLKVLEKAVSVTLTTGETLDIKRSIHRVREYTVFIGNLPFGVDDGLMLDMFNDVLGANRFKRVFVGKDQFGRSRGYAFGIFDNPLDAKNAISVINGMELLGRVLRAEKGSNPKRAQPYADQGAFYSTQ